LHDDIDLMRRIRERDQQALNDVYNQYGGAVYSLALRVLGERTRAEEITQDVFLRVWNAPEKWDSAKGKLLSWLLTVTRYAAIDALRAALRKLDSQTSSIDDEIAPMGLPNISDWQEGQLLRRLLSQLPPDQAQVIDLAFYGGMTHQDLSDTLKLPLGTVKTRLRLGLQKLREMWLTESPEKS
jgi:RNA polymerase sigma-70 factor, ECF subfamily